MINALARTSLIVGARKEFKMPIYDYECKKCGLVSEHITKWNVVLNLGCTCGGDVRRIISVSGQYCGNESPTWLRSTLNVVDKENRASHIQNFIKNPTRETYKAWMKGEKIKPADYTVKGGPPVYEKPKRDIKKITDELYRRHRERNTLSLR